MIYNINKQLILENDFTQHFSNHGEKYIAGIGAGLAGLGAGYLSSGDNLEHLSNSAQETASNVSTAFKNGYRNNVSEPAAWIGETVKDGFNNNVAAPTQQAYNNTSNYVGNQYNQVADFANSKISQTQSDYQQHLLDNQMRDAQLAKANETAGLPAHPTMLQSAVSRGLHGINVAKDYLGNPIDARSAGMGAAGAAALGAAAAYGINRYRRR